ncbi:MAG: serine hydrolase, partial [Brachybacterium sp.]|nr:serine hydrolase [Brachybacterium sp.]
AGTADGPRISDGLWEQMSTDQLGPDLTIDGRYQQGLGLRIGVEAGDEGGDLVLPSVIGHPGFTGTSVHADRSTGTVAVLLTNRVHPRRHHFTVEAARRRLHSRAFGGSAPEA